MGAFFNLRGPDAAVWKPPWLPRWCWNYAGSSPWWGRDNQLSKLPKLYQLLKPWHATILICAAVLKSSFSSYVPKRKGLLAILIVVRGALIHIYTFVSEISVRLQNFVCTPNLLLAFWASLCGSHQAILCRLPLSNDDDMIIKWCSYHHNTTAGRCLADSGCGWYDNQEGNREHSQDSQGVMGQAGRLRHLFITTSLAIALANEAPNSQLSSGSIWIEAFPKDDDSWRWDPINVRAWQGVVRVSSVQWLMPFLSHPGIQSPSIQWSAFLPRHSHPPGCARGLNKVGTESANWCRVLLNPWHQICPNSPHSHSSRFILKVFASAGRSLINE